MTRRLTTKLFFLVLLLPSSVAAQSEAAAAQRDARMQAWSQQDLSPSLRAELEALYSQRQAHNANVAIRSQRWQQFRRNIDSYNSRCSSAATGTLSAARECIRKRQALEREQSELEPAGAGYASAAAALIARYDNLSRRIESYLATQRGADQGSWETAWQKGRTDAVSCSPSNGHGYCSGAGGDYSSCQDGYTRGFTDGSAVRDLAMQRAYEIGRSTGAAGEENESFNHPDAAGSCRISWVQEYNRGHLDGRQSGE